MFERFTERARQVVVLAQEEAKGFDLPNITDMQILAGLLREQEGLAARTLAQFNIDISRLRATVEERAHTVFDKKRIVDPGQIPFTPHAKAVFDNSLREALRMGHNYIGTEHILLGIIEYPVPATAWLSEQGVDLQEMAAEIVRMLAGPKEQPKRQRSTIHAHMEDPTDCEVLMDKAIKEVNDGEVPSAERAIVLSNLAIAAALNQFNAQNEAR